MQQVTEGPKCAVFFTPSPLKRRDQCERGSRKAVRVGDGGWHLPDTVGLMKRLQQHTQDLHTLRTNKVPALNRSRHKVPPLTKKIFAPDNLLGEGTQLCLMKGHWVLSTTLHSRSHVWTTQIGLHVFCVVFFAFV